MSFVSSQHQKRANAQLEHLAREAEIETNRRRLEIVELRRLERWQLREMLLIRDSDQFTAMGRVCRWVGRCHRLAFRHLHG